MPKFPDSRGANPDWGTVERNARFEKDVNIPLGEMLLPRASHPRAIMHSASAMLSLNGWSREDQAAALGRKFPIAGRSAHCGGAAHKPGRPRISTRVPSANGHFSVVSGTGRPWYPRSGHDIEHPEVHTRS